MTYIVTGVMGFLLLFLFDIAALKKIPRVKSLIWLAGIGLIISSSILMAVSPDKFSAPLWCTWLGWIVLPVGILLMIFPILVDLPFRQTYVRDGVGNRLVTTGFYSLVRCPWIHTSAFILLGITLASSSRLLLLASPVFVLVNILLAVVQDRYLFGRMFPGYARYRRETPMLLPNRASLKSFLKTTKLDLGNIAPRRSRK